MSHHKWAAALLILHGASSLAASPPSAADFAGAWNVTAHFAEGSTSAVLTLTAVDGKIKGSSAGLDTRSGFALAYDGTLEHGRLHLTVAIAPSSVNTVGELTLEIKRGSLQGTGTLYRVPVTLTGEKPDDKPHTPKTYDYVPTHYYTNLSGANPPALRIAPGDTVRTSTIDANGIDEHGQWAGMPGNTQTGPFYVEGAMPGDTLVVHLNRVRVNQTRAMMVCWGLNPNALPAGTPPEAPGQCGFGWTLDSTAGIARLAEPSARLKNFTVPLKPMLGTIGVAPPASQSISASDLGNYGGNLDYNRIVEGTTLYLPVYRAGALLTMGDAHALQGDGEITGQGLETSMAVEFTVGLTKGTTLGQPWAEDDEYVMVSGIGNSLGEALQSATGGMVRWLRDRYKLDMTDVAKVLGSSIQYDVAEIVDPRPHVVARLRKDLLAKIQPP
jgi:amidase